MTRTQDCYQLRRTGSLATVDGVGDIFLINKEITVIGRNAKQSDIFLDSSKNKALISRLHARILRSFDKSGSPVFEICDTSLNGTYVNDVKVSDTVEIKPGDTLTFGHLRGAILDPGTFAQQENSEFRFKFEVLPPRDKDNVPSTQSTSNDMANKKELDLEQTNKLSPLPKTPLVPTIEGVPDLSVFLSPNTPLRSERAAVMLPKSSKEQNIPQRDGRPTFCSLSPTEMQQVQATEYPVCTFTTSSDKELITHQVKPDCSSSNATSDDEDLLAMAVAAQSAMSDSDDELFSPYSPLDPNCSGGSSPVYPKCDSNVGTGTETLSLINDSEQVHKHNGRRSSVSRKRQRYHLTYKKSTKKMGNATTMTNLSHDLCAAVDCIRPHQYDKIVDWVACDDCHSWYHIKCTGLTLKAVDCSSAMFHCGCI